jgi:hypothetical protein
MSSIINDNCDDFNFDDSGESESNQSDNNSVKSSSTKSRNKWKWLPFLTFVNANNKRTNTRKHGLTDYTAEAIRTLIG